MAHWINLGQILKINAAKFPGAVAVKDANRGFTYPELNRRVNRLADSLLSMGLSKGDRVAVLMENNIEIVEVYLATAKTGLVIVPINFRLVSGEVEYILTNSDARALIMDPEFIPVVEPIRESLPNIEPDSYIVAGPPEKGYRPYEDLIENGMETEPDCKVLPQDTWVLIYTSGTTGHPKGVLRSHESHISFYLINAVDFEFNRSDICMNVMPLCHINSVFFTFLFLYIGARIYIHPARSFKPLEILDIIQKEKITFISLIPTHYNLILNVAEEGKKYDVSSIRQLLCSSAPVRQKMKSAVMDFFPGVKLYEAYGSTEAGIVTILRPEDQIRKICSIGYESLGTDFIKIINENGVQVQDGEIGEIYARGPMLFDGYYKLPEKTKEVFQDGWCSAGDLGRRDQDGFYEIVDRKANMIITGGENVYPSEVEEVLCSWPEVFDAAVIGLPDEKWGEKIAAVIITQENCRNNFDTKALIAFCRKQLAAFKCPKEIILIRPEEMPRTATGKILHRKLREKFGKSNECVL